MDDYEVMTPEQYKTILTNLVDCGIMSKAEMLKQVEELERFQRNEKFKAQKKITPTETYRALKL